MVDVLPTIADLASDRKQMKTIDGGSMKKVLFNSAMGKLKDRMMDFIFMSHTEIILPLGTSLIHYNRSL